VVARKGSIPIGMVQQSYSRGAPVSASASSASAATVSSTETQYWGSNEVGVFLSRHILDEINLSRYVRSDVLH
jgi:predicted ATP-grasp superfamily ATP-dependent carboligase